MQEVNREKTMYSIEKIKDVYNQMKAREPEAAQLAWLAKTIAEVNEKKQQSITKKAELEQELKADQDEVGKRRP